MLSMEVQTEMPSSAKIVEQKIAFEVQHATRAMKDRASETVQKSVADVESRLMESVNQRMFALEAKVNKVDEVAGKVDQLAVIVVMRQHRL